MASLESVSFGLQHNTSLNTSGQTYPSDSWLQNWPRTVRHLRSEEIRNLQLFHGLRLERVQVVPRCGHGRTTTKPLSEETENLMDCSLNPVANYETSTTLHIARRAS